MGRLHKEETLAVVFIESVRPFSSLHRRTASNALSDLSLPIHIPLILFRTMASAARVDFLTNAPKFIKRAKEANFEGQRIVDVSMSPSGMEIWFITAIKMTSKVLRPLIQLRKGVIV